jgi:hypothetical protein
MSDDTHTTEACDGSDSVLPGFRTQTATELRENNEWINSFFPGVTEGKAERSLLLELSNVRDHLTVAVRTYCLDLNLLLAHLRFLDEILNTALSRPANRIWRNRREKQWILDQVFQAFQGLASTIAVLKSMVAIPFDEHVLKESAQNIEWAFDLNGPGIDADEADCRVDELLIYGKLSHLVEIEKLATYVTLSSETKPSESVEGSTDLTLTHEDSLSITPRLASADTQDPQAAVSEDGKEKPPPQFSHSEDYRCVNWYGDVYDFTVAQAAVIQCLWEAWEARLPYVSESTICDAAAGDSKRVRDIFKVAGSKMHPAWKTMIVKKGNNLFFLKPPTDQEIPT